MSAARATLEKALELNTPLVRLVELQKKFTVEVEYELVMEKKGHNNDYEGTRGRGDGRVR